jgi:alpha-glucosidase
MQTAWWQSGVIYQVYPRSFMDSNGDGIGDLPGLLSRLDYLRWLGVNTIWLSPVYSSPMADFGYDIADFENVDPLFGTLQDLDQVIEQAHARGLKVILDYVPNHTSDEHEWFKESRSSLNNAKRDWYIWRDPAPGGGPPNNWLSLFGGSAWQFDQGTGQYYLHLYDVKQPDLNWRNPQVRQAMYDVVRFWMDRGVDGLRVDAFGGLIKDAQWRDNPLNEHWREGDPDDQQHIRRYTLDLPEVHEPLREIRQVIDSYEGRVLIAELYLPLNRLMLYYGADLDEAHLPFNFQLVTLSGWEAQAIQHLVDGYEEALPAQAWPNWVLGNHDRPRIATRIGREQARIAHMLLLTLRGTPTCYYGDELGMLDGEVPLEMMHDPRGKHKPELSRDYARTPMQWDSGPNAGFSVPDASPWLPVSTEYPRDNVEREQTDPHSFLTFVHALLQLRQALPALQVGSYRSIEQDNMSCFVYQRQLETQHYLVALNISNQEQMLRLPMQRNGTVLLSTHLDRGGLINLRAFQLRKNEGILIELAD